MKGYIVEYDEELNGVLIDDKAVKVSIPGALKSEEILYHVEHKSPHTPRAWGRCDGLISSSPQRCTPVCDIAWPVAGACAGCPLMHCVPSLQDELKKSLVLNALQNAGIHYIRDFVFHSETTRLGYRNRTDLVAAEKKGKLILGAYKTRSHDVVETRGCRILRQPLNQVMAFIVNQANQHRIPACRTFAQYAGALRYVSLFANDTGNVLVDLVCKSADGLKPEWLHKFAHALKGFKAIQGVSYSLNDTPHNAIRTAPSQTIWGLDRLPEHHGSVVSYFSASGFTQLNTDVAAKIYAAARDWLPARPAILWDLYCGAGAFGRTVQPYKALYGAEFSSSAIDAARKVAQNDPFETHFEVLDLDKTWPENWPEPDVVLVDPPRKGLSTAVMSKLMQMHVPTILYMSCNPESFAKNVATLDKSFVLERIEAFDMMPQTKHVEILGLLKRR